jgi:hypothetical protein
MLGGRSIVNWRWGGWGIWSHRDEPQKTLERDRSRLPAKTFTVPATCHTARVAGVNNKFSVRTHPLFVLTLWLDMWHYRSHNRARVAL